MRKIYILLLLVLFALPVFAKRLYPEKTYQNQWCTAQKGVQEYVLNDKARVDCLTKDYAVEFDFANKWAECIGQALYYGIQTNRKPACVLIMENWESDLKYFRRLQTVSKKTNLSTFTIKPEQIKN